MTLTLAPAEQPDADLLQGIAVGDVRSAARLWTRHWPAALEAARGLVEPAEVPGLAAEALIGTIAAIALGSGPVEDARAFVIAAVHELGEDESGAPTGTVAYPDVFASPVLRQAFDALTPEDQDVIRDAVLDGWGVLGPSLGRLQDGYLRLHARAAATPDCVDAHAYLGSAVDGDDELPVIPTHTWEHLSECVVCTEAFHELAHSAVALEALLVLTREPAPVPTAAPVAEPGDGVESDADRAAAAVAALLTALAADDAPAPDALTPEVEALVDPEPTVVAEREPVVPEPVVFEPVVPDPVSIAADAVAPGAPAPAVATEEDRRRRPLLLVLGAAVLASVLGVSVAFAGDDEPASEPSTAAVIPDSGPVLESAPPSVSDPALSGAAPAPASDVPVAGIKSPWAAPATSAQPATSAKPRPTSKATTKSTPGSTTPSASSPTTAGTPTRPATSPTPSPTPSKTPSPSKTPTPTPTPTEPPRTCSPLEVLFGCTPG